MIEREGTLEFFSTWAKRREFDPEQKFYAIAIGGLVTKGPVVSEHQFSIEVAAVGKATDGRLPVKVRPLVGDAPGVGALSDGSEITVFDGTTPIAHITFD
ncbi:hypothetical protein HDC94_002512 [Leifsonia sp. AK011]|uniref:hypothetical protein n=1 Tax=Leifsonia sp. AK011 TaxID=2723075 RepID=UPI0015CA154E|nr:hypothetical protein [Leifsonia sp. AK011]NYF11356.1 hypothetical protein [Leifsonia sp. AK011]